MSKFAYQIEPRTKRPVMCLCIPGVIKLVAACPMMSGHSYPGWVSCASRRNSHAVQDRLCYVQHNSASAGTAAGALSGHSRVQPQAEKCQLNVSRRQMVTMHGSSHAEADDAWVMSAEKDPLPRGLSGDMLARAGHQHRQLLHPPLSDRIPA